MKTFKQFIYEMPMLYHSPNDEKAKAERDKFRHHVMDLATKEHQLPRVSQTETHNVHMGGTNWRRFHFINKTTGKVDGVITGKHEEGTQRVSELETRPGSSMKSHEMYHHLVTHHGFTLRSSDNQNTGSAKVWERLSKMKGIAMKMKSGKKLHRKNWHKNYGVFPDWDHPKSKDTFIASKKNG